MDDIIIDENQKLIRFREKFISKIPIVYETIKNTVPEKRLEVLATILGYESLNEVEDYTKYFKIREGSIVVDAGAHVGVWTKKFSEMVGKDGLVLAIEPDYRALGMLTHNTAELKNVKILPYALWHTEDVIPFQFMDVSSGIGVGSLIYQFQYWHPTRAISLDKLLEKLNIREVNFIKMDIEGSEIHALEGASETLKRVDALAVASYHRIDNSGSKSYGAVTSILNSKGFTTRMEQGNDGEIVYANR